MTLSDSQFEQLSSLVDGELLDEKRCDVLTEIIDSPALRAELQQLVDLRRTTGSWRNAQHTIPRRNSAVHPFPAISGRLRTAGSETRRLTGFGYLAATVVGGVLVCIGLLLGGKVGSERSAIGPGRVPNNRVSNNRVPNSRVLHNQPPRVNRTQIVVEPQHRQHAAEVFAFHESVAGPLSWFVSDEDEVLLGSPVAADVARRPVAIQLRIREGESHHPVGTYLVICRDRTRAAITLPVHDDRFGPVQLFVQVQIQDQGIAADYSLVFGALTNGSRGARLSGRRQLGVKQTPVGQVFLNDRLLTVDAAAWTFSEENPSL